MYKRTKKVITLWHFDHLSNYNNITHFCSGRSGGVSQGEYESLNLSLTAGDKESNVIKNRKRLANEMEITIDRFTFPQQTHSGNVKTIQSYEELKKPFEDTDALVTDLPDICIGVLTADCVPVVLYDKQNKVIGVVHSGWQGTMKKILSKTLNVFIEKYSSKPKNILIGIGPSIGPEDYEVGDEVVTKYQDAYGISSEQILDKKDNGKAMLNLWKANQLQAEALGVPEINIENSFLSTFKNNEIFFSARKQGAQCGRCGSGIMLKEK